MFIFEEPIRYEAVVQLTKEDFPSLNGAKVIITKGNDGMYIGVKSVYPKLMNESDRIFAKAEMVGDYCKIDDKKTIAEMFDCLKLMLERVGAMVEAGKKGEPIVGDRVNGEKA